MSDPYIGQIMPVGFNFPPRGWAFCDGQLLPIAQNTALFSLLGTTYGGDGRTTFALPDLRGRACVHVGTGPGLTPRSWGQRWGSENTPLNAHTHTVKAVGAAGDETSPVGSLPAISAGGAGDIYSGDLSTGNMSAEMIASAGSGSGGGANWPPALAVYWCIALVGIFPSRS